MSNASSTAYANGLQQHNLTAAIDYLNQNGSTTCGATFPNVTTSDNGLILKKPTTTGSYYTPVPNSTAYYSTQLVTQAPGTILITNNFGPDDASTISGVNNSFNNSSIRIVTHNNNTNNNNNNGKTTSLEEDKQIYHQLHHLHHQPSPATALQQHPSSTSQPMNPVKMPNSLVTTPALGTTTTTSTVVLDRINICINNHYGDTSTKSQQSPIIPSVIQHTTIVDAAAPCTPPLQSTETRTGPTTTLDIRIDEPDSTTSTNCHTEMVPMEQDLSGEIAQENESEKDISYESVITEHKFEIGEDVFVKRRDGRFYLGTVVNIHRQQYLVLFDDKTDYWSNVDELFKLSKIEKPTCLGCKQETDDDLIETCERCGRSYHQRCTDEVLPKTGEWMCKRCSKPMKYSFIEEAGDKILLKRKASRDCKKVIKQFPYELGSLTWDEKHRVNLEQIYCYCGKSGQFDNNMIQCCKCKQWFHAHCVECVKTLFRGDVFFIFGCSVCNHGKEFLRRIEMNWVDLTHLILYNMAIMKNFQKYHHLHKDIYPFAMEKRVALQLPASILNLSDSEFKANLLRTLQTHPKLFQCGKEIKKDHAFWGLRSNKPPQGLFYDIKPHEVLSNHLIKDKLKINILPTDDREGDDDDDEDEDEYDASQKCDKIEQPPAKKVKFGDKSDDDDKFTSDDEIPIKQILEKTKISNSSSDLREIKPEDSDNSNESPLVDDKNVKVQKKDDSQGKTTTSTTTKSSVQQKSSRKRKAFTLSKSYKDSDKSNDLPRIVCDSSSDENSSSSRGTLDLIIPPPKDFLGLNNPFRMLTPKKNENSASYKMTGNSCITKKTVSFGNSALDLNSKIAALRSTGLFPNISNSDIAKAAGQPRLVRTIKRRLSAKDIMIGPNQEVRRRRTRPQSSNVEVISTTTINPIVSAFFPIRASTNEATISTNNKNASASATSSSQSNSPHITSSASSSQDCVPGVTAASKTTTHGRRLRKRPEKSSPQNSRRNSISSSSSSNSCPAQLTLPPPTQPPNTVPMTDLKQSVNKYFGAVNRIEDGEKFVIRAKRRLTNGHLQYLIEWET